MIHNTVRVPFRGLVRDGGSESIIVTIPKAFVDGGQIIKGRKYIFEILTPPLEEEKKEGEKNEEKN